MKPVVIGLGEVLWDMLPEGKQLGGAPANFAYHATQQGADGLVVSRIGKDDLGNEIRETLDAKGLNAHLQVDAEFATGTVGVEFTEPGIPSYVINQPVAWDNIELDSNLKKLAASCNAACFGSLAQRSEASGNAIRGFVSETSEKALRIFDINLRQEFYSRELIEENLNLANIVKLNEEEYEILVSMFDLPKDELLFIREMISRFNLRNLVFTKGGDGSYFADKDSTSYLATPASEVVDTIGAGDSFTATIVMGLLQEKMLTEIHNEAIKIGAFVYGHQGDRPKYS
jgi:fructokinase